MELEDFILLPDGVPLPSSAVFISCNDGEIVLPSSEDDKDTLGPVSSVAFVNNISENGEYSVVGFDEALNVQPSDIHVFSVAGFFRSNNNEVVEEKHQYTTRLPVVEEDVENSLPVVDANECVGASKREVEQEQLHAENSLSAAELNNESGKKRTKRSCCASECWKDFSYTGRLYSFPSTIVRGKFDQGNYDRCKVWVRVSDNAAVALVDIAKLHNNYFMCEKHFEMNQFYNEKKLRLLPNAVPQQSKSYKLPSTHISDTDSASECENEKAHDVSAPVSDLNSVNECDNEQMDNVFCSAGGSDTDSVEDLSYSVSPQHNFQGVNETHMGEKQCGSKTCCFIDCTSNSMHKFYTLPRIIINDKLNQENVDRCKVWVRASGNADLLKCATDLLHKRFYVCGQHFGSDQFFKSSRKRLRPLANPTDCSTPLSNEALSNFPVLGNRMDVFAGVEFTPCVGDNYQRMFKKDMDQLKMFACSKCKEVFVSRYKPTNSCLHGIKCFNYQKENNMDPGEVPEELKRLSYIEEQLIARVHVFMSVFKLKAHQFGYKGNIIHFSQNVNEIAKSLPHDITNLKSVITIRTNSETSSKDFFVRAGRIRRALLWLKANNKYYADIDISEENLAKLPENGDVLELVPNLDVLCDDNDVEEEEDVAPVLKESGVFNFDSKNQNDQVNHVVNWPTLSDTPLSEFKSEGLTCKAFPTLFPYGEADLNGERNHPVKTSEYFKHLFRYHDRRFEVHPRFRYYVLNLTNRWNAIANGNLFINKKDEIKNMSIETLREELKSNPLLMKKIMYQGSNVRGTKQFWKARGQELVQMIEQLGMPTLFFTLSAADLHWPGLFKILAPDEDLDEMSESRRMELVANYPMTVDKYFGERVKSFTSKVVKPKYDVNDFWYRVEYQHRGSPHVHGVLWLKHAPDVSDLANKSPEDVQKVLDYFDQLITARNPDQNLPPALIHPCRKEFYEIVDTERDLAELMNKVQRHTQCKIGYCKKTPEGQCRFKYPKDCLKKSHIKFENDDIEYYPERNDRLLNKCNAYWLQLWRANMDLAPVLSKRALINYLAKYVSKSESKTKTFDELVKKVTENTKFGVRSTIQSLFIRLACDRDYSAQEVFHIIMGEKLVSAGHRNFVHLFFNLDEDWVAIDQKKRGESLVEKYKDRTVCLNNSLWDMARSYNFKFGKKLPNNNIVMVYPDLKFKENAVSNEKYFKLQVLLHVPWTSETNLNKTESSWEEIYNSNIDKINASRSICNLEMAKNASENDDDIEFQLVENVTSREDWMVLSAMQSNQNTNSFDLGRRHLDVSFDWNDASSKYAQYGSLEELKCFIEEAKKKEQESTLEEDFSNFKLNNDQQKVFDLLQRQINHVKSVGMITDPDIPRVIVLQGAAGSGKSFVIKKMAQTVRAEFCHDAILLLTPTGVASVNIGGSTYHSKLHIYDTLNYTPLKNHIARKFCNDMAEVKFVVIDEYSMVGARGLGMIDKRLREAAGKDEDFGGLFVYICGDVRQIPPIHDNPLYGSTASNYSIGRHGQLIWKNIKHSIVLKQIVRQEDPRFKELLDNMSMGKVTHEDYVYIKQRFISNVSREERMSFDNALKLSPTKKKVKATNEENLAKLCFTSDMQPVPLARISAKHNCNEAMQGSVDDAAGLQEELILGPSCKIMLRSNLWTEKGLVNGAIGTVVDILYEPGHKPPGDRPVVLICKFSDYAGPYLGDDLVNKFVPIPMISKNWNNKSGVSCVRTQFPVQCAYACTIHKAQGLTLCKVFVDIGNYESTPGLSFVAFSRCKSLKGLLLEPFTEARFLKINNSSAIAAKLKLESIIHMNQI